MAQEGDPLQKQEEDVDGSKDREMTALRISANDLENIPIGLAAMFISLLFCRNAIAHIVFCIMFAVGRVGHTIAYASQVPKVRGAMFMLAHLGLTGMLINAVIGAFWFV